MRLPRPTWHYRNRPLPICYNCSKLGDLARDCKLPPNSRGYHAQETKNVEFTNSAEIFELELAYDYYDLYYYWNNGP